MPLYNREKPVRSVAAFLWMPQIRLSFEHMSFLMPVFIRTLAGALVQAGLLPRNHPALTYGSEETGRYSLSRLLGEAWFQLRTTRATSDQWGVFASIVLMLVLVVGSIGAFLMTIAFGFGNTAQAQIFSHPNGPSDISGYSPSGPFDTGVPDDATAHSDYGIMMLEKVISAGAHGVGRPMQNATRALMETYNTGILIVASIMLFWLIIHIVVDTAKTGQVGGGRHNMVWVPIRIVFALALLIPLGSTGYSSGQFMVMKLAEWGSNFGTRAWVAYVEGILNSDNLLAPAAPMSIADIVVGYERIVVCQTAHNANAISGGATDAATLVAPRESLNLVKGQVVANYVNNANTNCGSVSYEVYPGIAGAAGTGAQLIAGASMNITDNMFQRINEFENTMREAYRQQLVALQPNISLLACKFVGSFEAYRDKEIPTCNGMKGTGTRPNASELNSLITTYAQGIQQSFDTGMQALERTTTGQSMTEIIRQRGWAGMGTWYHRISQLNSAVASAQRSSVTIAGPAFGENDQNANAQYIKDTKEMVEAFDTWWGQYLADKNTAAANTATGQASAADLASSQPQAGGFWSTLSRIKSILSSSPAEIMDAIIGAFSLVSNTWLIALLNGVNSVSAAQHNTYPMALLSQTGGNIFWTGTALFGVVAFVQGVASFAPTLTLTENILWPLLGKLGLTMMAAGLMLKFYIPIIPFVRTAFSVMTWIISVFEAVALVPVAALAHITGDGEGISGGASHVWKLWLNILLRPVMTVLGFVGAMLVYNGFIAYFHDTFMEAAAMGLPTSGVLGLAAGVALAIIYVFTMYTAANSVFKMLDIIPNALMRWIGGQADHSFDNNDDRGIMYAAAGLINGVGGLQKQQVKPPENNNNNSGPGATNATPTGGGGGGGGGP